MKTDKNNLQKLTDEKINSILKLSRITLKDIEPLNENETSKLMQVVTEKFNSLIGIERDTFLLKIEALCDEETKNQLWESNHNKITAVISILLHELGRMPSKKEIAQKTELSRQTVHKHLKEYKTHPLFLGQMEQFNFMSSKLLAKVFQYAINGDMAAAKLYFNIIGYANNGQQQNNTMIQNQNNYIQINGTVLSQETIQQLNAEQLNSIESILKTAVKME
jgi:predicted DNA-binding protein (UPF0251 family)